jgi:hypothetical protein
MGRWYWVWLWGTGGAVFALIAVLVASWASSIPALAAALFFYAAWRAYRAETLVVRDALFHRSRQTDV